MASIWAVFLLVLLLTFGEPDRTGLEEQKKMEYARFAEAAAMSKDDSSRKDGTISPTPMTGGVASVRLSKPRREDDLQTIMSGEYENRLDNDQFGARKPWYRRFYDFLSLITPPVRLCLGLLFAKTFTIEALASCTSTLTRHRYGWAVTQVGILGCINGFLVVPLSIMVGWLSTFYQDKTLMIWLVSVGCVGMFLLIDISDLQGVSDDHYNAGDRLAVSPVRYVIGYFISYCSIQSFEGIIGSALSKVIPTALASGTFNSGLLATLVDTVSHSNNNNKT